MPFSNPRPTLHIQLVLDRNLHPRRAEKRLARNEVPAPAQTAMRGLTKKSLKLSNPTCVIGGEEW